ncbi:hypothetical protein Fuma_05992 [Fuerstiella marisgermanici]|uniref:Uncharacterized protein n=1 Tax=Fuerstiella marisgermanici TaxID=1891926 RepID=A0A1P8WQK2_9PLAN|nr:hypothetical protein Fuma_05992 [Fuerstiella marisgermanici]
MSEPATPHILPLPSEAEGEVGRAKRGPGGGRVNGRRDQRNHLSPTLGPPPI